MLNTGMLYKNATPIKLKRITKARYQNISYFHQLKPFITWTLMN